MLLTYSILPMSHQPNLFGWNSEELSENECKTKECSACGGRFPLDKFRKYQSRKNCEDGRRGVCKSCERKGDLLIKEYKKKNPIPDNFSCPICLKTTEDYHNAGRFLGRKHAFAVDHCHKTMLVRGWVCMFCNSAMGYIQDNPDNARRMIEFLNKDA